MSAPSISQLVVPWSSAGAAIVYIDQEEAWKVSPEGSSGVISVFPAMTIALPMSAATIGITTSPTALATSPSAPKTVRFTPRRRRRGAGA